MSRIDVFKPTQDDWFGSYEIAGDSRFNYLVLVSFTQTGPNPNLGEGMWRVCVWGNDDFGMERDFTDEDEAFNMFHQVISWKYVNMTELYAINFVTA